MHIIMRSCSKNTIVEVASFKVCGGILGGVTFRRTEGSGWSALGLLENTSKNAADQWKLPRVVALIIGPYAYAPVLCSRARDFRIHRALVLDDLVV
jgi:hypothetical protein